VSADENRIRDDAAAWVLGALSEEEARDFQRLLESSAVAREEVEELRRVTDALPFAVDPVAPPPELRSRIMAVVDSEAQLLRAVDAPADRSRERRRARRWSGFLRPIPLAAAACALLLAGVGAGLIVSGGGGEPARTVVAKVSGADSGAARARLEIADGRAELIVDGMRAPGADRVYQVWLLHEGETKPVSAGSLFEVDRSGHGTAAVADVEDVQAVMVSSEPDGGSEQPTTDPVVVATLT
jgi:anti-sigma-K factor RskA